MPVGDAESVLVAGVNENRDALTAFTDAPTEVPELATTILHVGSPLHHRCTTLGDAVTEVVDAVTAFGSGIDDSPDAGTEDRETVMTLADPM